MSGVHISFFIKKRKRYKLIQRLESRHKSIPYAHCSSFSRKIIEDYFKTRMNLHFISPSSANFENQKHNKNCFDNHNTHQNLVIFQSSLDFSHTRHIQGIHNHFVS